MFLLIFYRYPLLELLGRAPVSLFFCVVVFFILFMLFIFNFSVRILYKSLFKPPPSPFLFPKRTVCNSGSNGLPIVTAASCNCRSSFIFILYDFFILFSVLCEVYLWRIMEKLLLEEMRKNHFFLYK